MRQSRKSHAVFYSYHSRSVSNIIHPFDDASGDLRHNCGGFMCLVRFRRYCLQNRTDILCIWTLRGINHDYAHQSIIGDGKFYQAQSRDRFLWQCDRSDQGRNPAHASRGKSHGHMAICDQAAKMSAPPVHILHNQDRFPFRMPRR